MVSDKLYQTLDCDIASYICIKQEHLFKLSDLAKECDIFSVNKGKTTNETHTLSRKRKLLKIMVKIINFSKNHKNAKHHLNQMKEK